MGKLKSHKSTLKRFKITKSGKFKFKAMGWSHKNAKKGAKIKYRKNLRRVLSEASKRSLVKLIPGLSTVSK